MYDLYLTINFLDASYILVFFCHLSNDLISQFIGLFLDKFVFFLGITFLNSR